MKTFADFGIDTKGKASGEVKVICPQCSAHRKKRTYPCLNVNIDKRVWHCWHCGWAGGIKEGTWQPPMKMRPVYRKPDYVGSSEKLSDPMVQWFSERGISERVIKRNQIGLGKRYFPQVEEERPCIQFPFTRGTEVVNIKSRTRDKLFRMEAGCERVLYGLNDIDPSMLVWVEGEVDKLSVEEAGIESCVSVPDGAPSVDARDYSNKFDFMAEEAIGAVERHVIAVDTDAPGIKLRDELVRRLGPEKCLIVRWPDGCKDANDVLKEYGAERLRSCIDAAEPVPVEGVHSAAEFYAEVMEQYEHGRPNGHSTGWTEVDRHYTVMLGEWTLVTGIPGHGKSEWLDALLVNLASAHGWKFAVFSAENMPVSDHLVKIAEKLMGKPFDAGPTERMTRTEIDIAMTWIDEHFEFMLPESPTIDTLIEQCKRLILQRGVNGIVLDPWNEIEHGFDGDMPETRYISETLSKLRRMARQHNVHLWIVAHPRMLQKERGETGEPIPRPYDIAGSAHWNNKADCIVCVWRDRAADTQDVEVHVQKVRKKRVGKVGKAVLTYDRVTGRYHDPRVDENGRQYEYSHYREPKQ